MEVPLWRVRTLAGLVQATVAMAACLVPVWRAMRTDPIAALRED